MEEKMTQISQSWNPPNRLQMEEFIKLENKYLKGRTEEKGFIFNLKKVIYKTLTFNSFMFNNVYAHIVWIKVYGFKAIFTRKYDEYDL
jgi:hypothetical protein